MRRRVYEVESSPIRPLGRTGKQVHRLNMRMSDRDVEFLEELKTRLGGRFGTTDVIRMGLGELADRLGVLRPEMRR